MKDKTTHLYVDSHEWKLILHSLVELKNALIRQGRYLRKGKAQGRIGQRCARQSDPN